MRTIASAGFIFTLVFTAHAVADDWPQWMGSNRDSVWRETGVIDRIPDEGLKVQWRTPIGLGYAGPAVADGRVFVTDYKKTSGNLGNNPGGRDKLEGVERILCLDAKTGKEIWKHEYERSYNISYGGGPRCTPTVDGAKVYVLGAEGDLFCMKVDDGDIIWKKEPSKEYEAETPFWGHSAHPLVDGDFLYCMVGGRGSVVVAFDKNTGKEVWRALDAPDAGYCPPTMIDHAGSKQLLIWHPLAINSLDPKTGKVYWSIPLKPSYRMSITAPRKLGDLLYASAIGNISALIKLDSSKPGAEVVWRGKAKQAVYCANSTPYLEDDLIYGVDCNSGALIAARTEDGERLWETFKPTTGDRRAGHGNAFLVKHEGQFFLFSETGDLILARLSPKGYEERGRFHILEPTEDVFNRKVVWSHPAFADKCVFARNDKEIVCVSLASP